jgi:hypothetical protein
MEDLKPVSLRQDSHAVCAVPTALIKRPGEQIRAIAVVEMEVLRVTRTF